MKRFLSLLLILLLTFGLCACADTEPDWVEPTLSLAQRAEKEVQEELRVYIYVSYPVLEFPNVTTAVTDLGGNQYGVTGEVTFTDANGKFLRGIYEANVVYFPDVDNFHVTYTLDFQ